LAITITGISLEASSRRFGESLGAAAWAKAWGMVTAAFPSPPTVPRILIVAAHPQLAESHVTRALHDAVREQQARGALAEVALRDLYALYPDYWIDVPTEQAALAQAELVVWLHPTYWYSMPPLMKLWLDEVFAFHWAYGPGGNALRGKALWLATSTGGTAEAYHPSGHNRYFFDSFLHPHEQTAALTGMRWLPPLVLHGAHRVGSSELAAHADVFVDRLARWPAWPELAGDDDPVACDVAAADRPA
jgi:glutathione-regulated potassium-efflux system ancillary protein KefF